MIIQQQIENVICDEKIIIVYHPVKRKPQPKHSYQSKPNCLCLDLLRSYRHNWNSAFSTINTANMHKVALKWLSQAHYAEA